VTTRRVRFSVGPVEAAEGAGTAGSPAVAQSFEPKKSALRSATGSKLTQVSTISGATGNGTTTYAYDPLGRLTTYTPPAALQAGAYTWNGQPDRASIKIGTGATVTTTFDPASRPTSDTAGGTYTSDHEGRLTGFPGKILIYDALGRLVQVKASSDGSVLATYTYDALDRLRTVGESGVTTRFRYVGASTSVAQVIDNSSGSVIANHATDLAGIELYDFTPGGASQAYLGRNGHNDVTWTASSTGAVSATAAYDPFGGLVASTGSVGNSRWQGSWQDTVTGLYYVIARWYAPTLGRFISNDPVSGDTAKPQSRDLYAYGAGDPVDGIDPDGRMFLHDDGREVVSAPRCNVGGLFGSLVALSGWQCRGSFSRRVVPTSSLPPTHGTRELTLVPWRSTAGCGDEAETAGPTTHTCASFSGIGGQVWNGTVMQANVDLGEGVGPGPIAFKLTVHPSISLWFGGAIVGGYSDMHGQFSVFASLRSSVMAGDRSGTAHAVYKTLKSLEQSCYAIGLGPIALPPYCSPPNGEWAPTAPLEYPFSLDTPGSPERYAYLELDAWAWGSGTFSSAKAEVWLGNASATVTW
jgi:RHS repeat-associated protein